MSFFYGHSHTKSPSKSSNCDIMSEIEPLVSSIDSDLPVEHMRTLEDQVR